MKKKQLKDLRAKSLEELTKEADGGRFETVKVRAEIQTAREKNLKKLKNLRRNLAQILTIKREKEILEANLASKERKTQDSRKKKSS